jgi:hypothetical protein
MQSVDESSGGTDTAQIMIIIYGIVSAFHVYKELASSF